MHLREQLPELFSYHPPSNSVWDQSVDYGVGAPFCRLIGRTANLAEKSPELPSPRISLLGVLSLVVTLLVGACGPDDVGQSSLIERSVPPDTTALTDEIRNQGGPVVLELTGWATSRVIEEIVDAGLGPLPGYERVERLDSMGMNLVGGTVAPGDMDAVLAVPYIVSVRPADVDGQRR